MELRFALQVEKDSVPPPYQYVILCSGDFNCLGFMDRFGKWRDAHTLQELPEIEGWIDG